MAFKKVAEISIDKLEDIGGNVYLTADTPLRVKNKLYSQKGMDNDRYTIQRLFYPAYGLSGWTAN